MTILVTVPPDYSVDLPITLDLLKAHLSMLPAETDYDALISMYLVSAIEEFTSTTGRAILTQTVRQSFDCFPCEDFFLLERAPLIGAVVIEYYDQEEVLTVLPATVYSVASDLNPPIVQLKTGQIWPTNIHRTRLNSVRLTYECGYGDDDTFVPPDIKRILSMLVGDSYLHRENSITQPGIVTVTVLPSAANGMAKHKLNFHEHNSQSRRAGSYQDLRWPTVG